MVSEAAFLVERIAWPVGSDDWEVGCAPTGQLLIVHIIDEEDDAKDCENYEKKETDSLEPLSTSFAGVP